jgi:hypothetical protein
MPSSSIDSIIPVLSADHRKVFIKKNGPPVLYFPEWRMYLAKFNLLNITFMPMASDVYGSMSVTFLSILTKAAEMISEISVIPLHQVAKHWIQRISFAINKFHCETFSDKRIFVNGGNNRAQDRSAFRKYVIDDTTKI